MGVPPSSQQGIRHPARYVKELLCQDTSVREADHNDFISMESLTRSLENGEELWNYLNDN